MTTPETPAEPFPIWVVWREDEPAYGYFATEGIAKQATIDCWEEDEPVCPDYSWRPDGPGWELLVGGERAEVYISRHLVYGGLPAPAVPSSRAAALTEAADALLPIWEAVYEPGNVSTYLIGYTNDEAPARAAAEAWLRSQADVTGRLEWVPWGDVTPMPDGYDAWDELVEHHDDGIPTGPGLLVRRRMAAEAQQPDGQDDGTPDTLPAWLYQRFMPHGEGWDNLDDDQRSYWEHHAAAVRRAVGRGGFKTAVPPAEPAHVGGNAEDCPACSGTNPPYPFICPGPKKPPMDPVHILGIGAEPEDPQETQR